MAIKPSPHLAILLVLSHAAVGIVVSVTAMPLAARLTMLILILLNLLYHLAHDALLLFPSSWCEILFDRDCVSVVMRNGSGFSGRIESKTSVSPRFIVLRIRPEGHRLPVFRAIFPDALGTDEFRELCVHLKWSFSN